MIVVQTLAKKVMIRNSRWPPCPYNWQWCLRGAIHDQHGPLFLFTFMYFKRFVTFKIYDKHDDFDIDLVNFPLVMFYLLRG